MHTPCRGDCPPFDRSKTSSLHVSMYVCTGAETKGSCRGEHGCKQPACGERGEDDAQRGALRSTWRNQRCTAQPKDAQYTVCRTLGRAAGKDTNVMKHPSHPAASQPPKGTPADPARTSTTARGLTTAAIHRSRSHGTYRAPHHQLSTSNIHSVAIIRMWS